MNNLTQPPEDKKFISLYKQVLLGQIPYYQALIDKRGIKPFSQYKPVIAESFRNYVVKKLQEGLLPYIHVYPTANDCFITSDDYYLYNTYLDFNFSAIPCFVLGTPEGKFVTKKRKVEPKSISPVEFINLK